jgi:putative transposase
MVPQSPDGLARALGETHRQYTGFVNARARWTGHLFQGRFASVARCTLIAAARYVALNPVRARLVAQAQDWAWSSARAYAAARNDALVTVAPLLDRVGRGTDLIGIEAEPAALAHLRAAESSGRPLGSDEFLRCSNGASGAACVRASRGESHATSPRPHRSKWNWWNR